MTYQKVEGALELLEDVDEVDRTELPALGDAGQLGAVASLVGLDLGAEPLDVVDAVVEQNGVLLLWILTDAILKAGSVKSQRLSCLGSH